MADNKKKSDLIGQATNFVWSFHGTMVIAILVADQMYFTRLVGSQCSTYCHSSPSIWGLDPARIFLGRISLFRSLIYFSWSVPNPRSFLPFFSMISHLVELALKIRTQ